MTSALTTEFVHIPGSQFLMGSDRFYPEERPVHEVDVEAFWIERHLVTNAQFARFVDETRYVTLAERPLNPEDYPGAPQDLLKPGGLVFQAPVHPVPLDDATRWWAYIPGADWRHPRGPGTNLEGLSDHPVVQVSYEDAEAYATWRGARMPTEAEWETAARGGLQAALYCWGDVRHPEGRQMANTWQGEFPWKNLALDGYEGTSPVGTFPANGYGLTDMAGNVWEWTADWWQDRHRSTVPCCSSSGRNQAGRAEMDSASPGERFGRKVIKGGSHLCAPNYCLRFRPSARQPEALDTTTCHIGFRCASSQAPGSRDGQGM